MMLIVRSFLPAGFLPDGFEELPDVLKDDEGRSETFDDDDDEEDDYEEDEEDHYRYHDDEGEWNQAGHHIPQPACTSPISKPGHDDHDGEDCDDHNEDCDDHDEIFGNYDENCDDHDDYEDDLLWVCLNLLKDGGEDGDEEIQQHHVPNQHVARQEGKGEIAEKEMQNVSLEMKNVKSGDSAESRS